MSDVQIYHNPRCSKSRAALAAIDETGLDAEVTLYLKTPPSATELRRLVDIVDDEPSALVRRDPAFREAGLTAADVQTPEQVVDVLTRYPALMERPVIVRGDRAIIGRPTERVAPFLA